MLTRLMRLAATAAHKLLSIGWFLRRPKTYGAHALALTAQGRIILVKLWYAPGWRFPGGGRNADEPALDAALRELREEIGMTAHGAADLACELEEVVDFRSDNCSIVVVRDVEYRPKRWNWEVQSVREVSPDDLPADLSPQARRWLKAVGPAI